MPLSKRITLILFVCSLLAFGAALLFRLCDRRDLVSGLGPRQSAQYTATATITAQPPSRVAQLETPTPTATATPTAEVTGTPHHVYLPGIAAQGQPSATPSPRVTPTVTNTPAPTPTPVIPWPDALAAPGRSKLGLHVQWNNSPEIMEFIRRMRPAVIKAIDDLGFVAEVKQASPDTVIVARITLDQQPMEGDPEAMARALVESNLSTYSTHPAVDYWEGYNEPAVQGRMEWYARFEAERVRAMAEHGFKTAIGSFSTGVPEYEDFVAFLPAVREAAAYGGILSLHEYDAPTMDRSVGSGLPGREAHADRGALTLRYRWWYEDILKPQGLAIPLVVTEAGVDGLVANRPGPADAHGFLDFFSYWREQNSGADPLYVYLDQLRWYDSELEKDDYVIGWALFTAGALDDRWKSYDVTAFLRYIARDIIVPQAH